MFEIDEILTKNNVFWLKMTDTNTRIILTFVDNLIDFRLFNKETIYVKEFDFDSETVSFAGDLSEDGNEYDILVSSGDEEALYLNMYYSLDNNLVASIIEKGERREIITIPEALLN